MHRAIVLACLLCAALTLPTDAHAAKPLQRDWTMWQKDVRGSRFNRSERTITRRNAKRLQLKWAFAFPNSDAASSQPAIVGRTLYVGGRDGRFYALDRTTGAVKWSFDATTVTHTPPATVPSQGAGAGAAPVAGSTLLRDGPAVGNGLVYFGDNKANLYALDARTGALRWVTKLDAFPYAVITGSPLLSRGRLYIGVSSVEEGLGLVPFYECCHFRGSFLSVNARTGRVLWRYSTIEPAAKTGTNAFGAARYSPSGVAVWASAALDPATHTVFFGTGNNYSGSSSREDSVIALNAVTGRERWVRQLTHGDAWTLDCAFGAPYNCPNPGPDYDFGATPNIYSLTSRGRRPRRRTVVGIGQKSGVYHALDARTGRILWQTELSSPHGSGGPNFQQGIQWGSAFDGRRLYVATAAASPGQLFALAPATGRVLWHKPNPADGCTTGGGAGFTDSHDCQLSMPAAVTGTPGLVYEGSLDGKMRVFDSRSGRLLWRYDTAQAFTGVNGVDGNGGSIGGAGAAVAHGMLFVNSGYNTEEIPGTGIKGNVLLAFGLPPGPRGAGSPRPLAASAAGHGRAAISRCVDIYNGESNQQQHDTTTGWHDAAGRPLDGVQANMEADGGRCLLTVRMVRGRRAFRFLESLRGAQFRPASQASGARLGPPRTWNLGVSRDGTLTLRP